MNDARENKGPYETEGYFVEVDRVVPQSFGIPTMLLVFEFERRNVPKGENFRDYADGVLHYRLAEQINELHGERGLDILLGVAEQGLNQGENTFEEQHPDDTLVYKVWETPTMIWADIGVIGRKIADFHPSMLQTGRKLGSDGLHVGSLGRQRGWGSSISYGVLDFLAFDKSITQAGDRYGRGAVLLGVDTTWPGSYYQTQQLQQR